MPAKKAVWRRDTHETRDSGACCQKKLKKGQNIIELFSDIDKDKDGSVSIFELRLFMRNNGIKASDDEVYDFLKCFDKNKDFRLNLKEFADFIDRIPAA